jgi:hypothetical protein
MAASSGSTDPVLTPKLKLRRQLVADAIKNWVAQTIDMANPPRYPGLRMIQIALRNVVIALGFHIARIFKISRRPP